MTRPQRTDRHRRLPLRTTVALLLSALLGAAAPGLARPFDELRAETASSLATQSEATILALLDAGLAEHKPTQAVDVAQRWLRDNVASDPALLYKAGRAAELSGDWRAAASLYRQFLTRADLSTPAADDAVLGVYTLLLDQLDDPESAYAYARADGHRLVASAQARQFDRWFLDAARGRNDRDAVATRLLALVEAKAPNDLLIAKYEDDFRWLLDSIRTARLDEGRFSPDLAPTVRSLASKMTFDDELKLSLAFEVSAKAYNMALLAGEQATAPVAEAAALLQRFPHQAVRVQTAWAGGSRSRYYRGDPRKYWPLELDAKLKPVRDAAGKLSPVELAELHDSWSRSYYDSGPQVIGPDRAVEWVQANPKLANSRTAPRLSFEWNKLSYADAVKLAPLLELNPSPDAAVVRAIVAAGEGKSFDKALDALLTTEAWRLSDAELNFALADQLWQWAGRPGGNAARDKATARSKSLAQLIHRGDAKASDPAEKRLAACATLWQDYLSAQPKLPGVRQRLVNALRITPEALPDALKQASPEAQLLVREALEAGIRGTSPADSVYDRYLGVATDRYIPCIHWIMGQHRMGSLAELKQHRPNAYVPHPLGLTIEQALTQQLKQNAVQPWLVLAWLNTRFPESDEASQTLMGQLLASPAWKTMPYEVRFGARDWFKRVALTPAQLALVDASNPALVCKDVLALPKSADAATTEAAMRKMIEGLRASSVRMEPRGLTRLGELNPGVLESPQVFPLVLEIVGPMRSFEADWTFGERLLGAVQKHRDPQELHLTSAYLWRVTQVHHRSLRAMIDLAESLVADHPSAAQTLASCGLQTIGRYKGGHSYFSRDTDIPRLKSIRGKALLAMGLIDIPVPPNHPAYSIFKSQSEFAIGNEDSARELLAEHADQLLPVHRKLSAAYLLWVLRYTIDQRDQARQEELAKALLAWMNETPGAFSVDQRVELEIAYGDIAQQRGMLPEAHRIFTRVYKNKAYESVYARYTAALRGVLVDRVAGAYDQALQTLLELEGAKIPRLTSEVQYQRAEVFYAMEDYERAGEEVAKVLEREPDHADATILRGRIQLKLQRLIEATEVEVGSTTNQDTLVPGEMLKVTLNDPTLAVSSGASDIEVVVWATSGDREHLLLRQFGDQKTKFRGEVRTALGKPTPDDNVLQVIGDDEVFYAYSERFRVKMVDLAESRGGPIKIASDAIIMASARRLLTENEQRVADMRAATEILAARGDRSVAPERLAELQAAASESARRAMLEARVKPGNPIHLRVVDPDRSRTGDIDQVQVNVSSSSGDTIGQVVLTESDTHSGRFEGRVETTKAQPVALASSTEAGRSPNMVISPRDDYPAWQPVAEPGARHSITVDLNDNVALGSLTIDAGDEGNKLTKFLVQTAIDPNQWTTVASYPSARMLVSDPWRPNVTVINEEGRRAHYGARSVYELSDLRRHMETGWLATPDQALAMNVAGPSEALPKSVLSEVKWQRSGRWPNPGVVVKFEAYFYEPQRVNRRFQLTLGKHQIKAQDKEQKDPPQFLMAIDGAVITSANDDKLQGARDLRPGVHKLEIWATGWIENIGFGRTVALQANLNDPETLVDCPDTFFDPATFPPAAVDRRNAPAALKPTEDGRQFTVDFGPQAQGRLIRLALIDQEGPAPSIKRLSLTDAQGARVLPVPTDYAELRKNDRLEIVSGDRITVRYVDDRYVTRGKQKHERFLNAAYTDAGIEFADIEPRFSSRHNGKVPYHEQLLRFAMDKPLPIVVNDADMDVSVEPDRITVKIAGVAGAERELIAEETGPSTGVFRAWVTPVANATSEAGQIQVAPGGTLVATYHDAENLRPGVPYDRIATIRHATFSVPQIEVAHAIITPYVPAPGEPSADQSEPLNERLEALHVETDEAQRGRYQDLIKRRYVITQEFLSPAKAPADGLAVVHGRHALIDVSAPDLALGEATSLDIYLQTDAGRAAAKTPEGAEFDPNVPGTIRITGGLNAGARLYFPQRGGYRVTFAHPQGSEADRIRVSRETGRFRFAVPIINGSLPAQSFAQPQREDEPALPSPDGLIARAGERIHIGVPYTDPQGNRRWATASARVITQAMLDVLNEDYRTPIESAHVGEKLFLRVVDPAEDRTEARDMLKVYVASKSGRKHFMQLDETDIHSGVFKGVCTLTYADKAPDAGEDYDVRRDGLPVTYGDAVGVRYTDASGADTPVLYVAIAKGSDGTIVALSKRYDDDDTAMRTQFAMAEAFLELADRHHKLNEPEAAERELARARQLLASVVAQFTDPETRAHAEYLLGNMTSADAERSKDRDTREDRYHAALARFMTVTGTYPNTAWAAKAQFQTAVVYEQLGEADVAAQEYVKLAYKYPDSEDLATAMARLGTHFQRKAIAYEEQAKPFLEKADDKDAQFEAQVLTKLSTKEYIKAAQIFERLQSRFPDHALAGKSGLRAGQIYMRAGQYADAIKALQSVIDNESYDGVELRSEAMYWAGRCHQLTRQQLLAYALFKRITYDFPESQWAAYARAQLSTEAMLNLDEKLEIERLESGR